MYLREALRLAPDAMLDPTRPLSIGEMLLSIDAAIEADRILRGGEFQGAVSCEKIEERDAFYWDVGCADGTQGEIFGFATGVDAPLPTAIEVGIVRALAASSPDSHQEILGGNRRIAIGASQALLPFIKIDRNVRRPVSGRSVLTTARTQVVIRDYANVRLSQTALTCLANSFLASPLKFKFLELYRVMEGRFLAGVKERFLTKFDSEPKTAVDEASESLKSELRQFVSLSEGHENIFESIYIAIKKSKDSGNRFSHALFRKLGKKEEAISQSQSASGAALIYFIRCAIVHAGGKDIIFEGFPDGDDLLNAISDEVELAALILVGIEVL